MIWTVFLLLFVAVAVDNKTINCKHSESKFEPVDTKQKANINDKWTPAQNDTKPTNETVDRLIFSQVIFRHGSRTIRLTYPKDPYQDRKYWPEGFGHLTTRGKQQEYELGTFFRRRYHKLLGDGSYSPDKVYAVSSQLDRTQNSAELVLAGLFPPQNQQVWNKHLLWQPVPVHIIPRKDDHLIKHRPACRRYNKKLNEYIKSSKIKKITKEQQSLFRYLEKNSGKSIRSIEDVTNLYDTLSVEHYLNKTLPKWTQGKLTEMENLAGYRFKLITGTNELKKLYSGFLLKEILDRFDEKANLNLKPDRSMWLYSAHDVTIASMLNTIGVFEPHIPPYASTLMFELYESNGQHYVQLFYRHSITEHPTLLNIPHCGTKCSLSEFRELYSKILPSNYKKECHGHK